MADEFLAPLNAEQRLPPLDEIARELCAVNSYTCERSAAGQATFRFCRQERRRHWPEDFILTHRGGDLLLTVHAATRSERETLLRNLESTLNRHGVALSFKEV